MFSEGSPRRPVVCEQAVATEAWKVAKASQACGFRSEFERLFAAFESAPNLADYGVHSGVRMVVSFAHERKSFHWFTTTVSWATLLLLMDANQPSATKDSVIFLPGVLLGGEAPEGTRRLKQNVGSLGLVVLDFDKGDAPLDKLEARMRELGLESGMYATFSHGKNTTQLAWSVTQPDAKTGTVETKPTAFQKFARSRLGADDDAELRLSAVPGAIARAYMIEEQGFDAAVLGDVRVLESDRLETETVKGEGGRRHKIETLYVVVRHDPLAKSRLVIPLASPVSRLQGESDEAFQRRWQQEVYLPLGRLIGFSFDTTCASIERGHYIMTRREGAEPVAARHLEGRLLDLADPELQALLEPLRAAPFESSKKEPGNKRAEGGTQERCASGEGAGFDDNWRGFLAADAAADSLPSVTDKRSDESKPLVAFPCPFVHEHATSNDPKAHQCFAFNASAPDRIPVVKCQSNTCRGRRYGEFLGALFNAGVKSNPKYRLSESGPNAGGSAQATGVYIPRNALTATLHEINRTWAVVRVGGRVRYLHETLEGDIELYDAKSIADWHANWFFFWDDKRGRREESILAAWLTWQYRRQFRGIRFCPEPEGAPEGVFNTYFGFAVEPRRGSWKRLLGHIYRNVCRRDAKHFRFFMAWLAQLIQEPHVKPGTNIVLKGKEGTGKSKVGECILALLGRNALVVSESERITGRFNAHLENKLFLMAEEAFWAGDKAAEGKLKDLATGTNMSYERKGLDPYEGRNYTRIMIASNEDWVVPASSGGRRWFVLEVGDEHEKDHAYFAAIDEEMQGGGYAAMLYDLQQSDLPRQVNVRSAPVTPWLVEQRLHSYDNKHRWWRGVLQEGGFRDNEAGTFIPLEFGRCTAVKREDVFQSAKPYFAGPKGVAPTPSDVGQFLRKTLGELAESRPTIDGRRHWCSVFPPLDELRKRWLQDTGELIEEETAAAAGPNEAGRASPNAAPMSGVKVSLADDIFDFGTGPSARRRDALDAAIARGVTDPQELARIVEEALRADASGERDTATTRQARH